MPDDVFAVFFIDVNLHCQLPCGGMVKRPGHCTGSLKQDLSTSVPYPHTSGMASRQNYFANKRLATCFNEGLFSQDYFIPKLHAVLPLESVFNFASDF